jgi:beta-carotene hydroxylase
MLRFKADRKTVLWMAATTVLFLVQWRLGRVHWGLYVPYVYLSVAVAVIAHNHNHVRLWHSTGLNVLTDLWLTLFYGFPVFAWVPTHNQNHHKYHNTAPDHTHTWRVWEGNHLVALLTYPLISAYYQQQAIGRYLVVVRTANRSRFGICLGQIGGLGTWVAAALVLDWQKALLFVVIPQQVALNTVLVFNYLQHVHADEEDPWNHSRNFTGQLLNFFLFNNGYHTIHHLQPGLHWSATPAAHCQIAHHITPALNERSFVWYLVRTYFLGVFRGSEALDPQMPARGFPYRACALLRGKLPRGQEERGMENYRVFQGKDTRQVDGHTGKAALKDSWYYEPSDYEGDVLYSVAYASREAAYEAAEEEFGAEGVG